MIAASIKTVQTLSNEGEGIMIYSPWTQESLYYIALVSFIINALMYRLDSNNKYAYLIVFGFSLSFLNVSNFQLLGISLVLLGLVFQFVLSIRKS